MRSRLFCSCGCAKKGTPGAVRGTSTTTCQVQPTLRDPRPDMAGWTTHSLTYQRGANNGWCAQTTGAHRALSSTLYAANSLSGQTHLRTWPHNVKTHT